MSEIQGDDQLDRPVRGDETEVIERGAEPIEDREAPNWRMAALAVTLAAQPVFYLLMQASIIASGQPASDKLAWSAALVLVVAFVVSGLIRSAAKELGR